MALSPTLQKAMSVNLKDIFKNTDISKSLVQPAGTASAWISLGIIGAAVIGAGVLVYKKKHRAATPNWDDGDYGDDWGY